MFTILAIIGGIITVFAAGGMYGEITGTKKTLSRLPMLSLPTDEDEYEDVGVEDEDLGYEDSDEERRE